MFAQKFILLSLLAGLVLAEQQPQGEVSSAQTVSVVNQPPHVVGHSVVSEEAPQVVGEHQHQAHMVNQPQQPQYYAPAGVIQVLGGEPQQAPPQVVGVKPQQPGQQQQVVAPQQPALRQYSAAGAEQYGQPEVASIPPNYKPFGSWGLYIGGNPADGYYTSYYKALSQSVADKQQVSADSKPGSPQAVVSQASGFSSAGASPMLKQGPVSGSFPYAYQDQGYPYDSSYYTPAELNSGSRVSVGPQQFAPASSAIYSAGSPAYPDQGLSYASLASPIDSYYGSTKRLGQSSSSSSYGTKEAPREIQSPAKGYQQRPLGYYSYASGSPLVYSAAGQPAVVGQQHSQQHHHQHHQGAQVVAYPVPVGSQIVGSQPGVDGAFQPFGVHGFTRYAIKPTVVAGEQQAYYHNGVHSSPVSQFPVYKPAVGYQQPLSFYGYPLSQLHYSQGSISPSFGPSEGSSSVSSSSSSSSSSGPIQHHQVGGEQGPVMAHSPLGMPVGVEGSSSDKSESKVESSNSKPASKPQQQ